MSHDISYRRILHRMGYYNYQQALIYRHLNQEGGWNSHLQNCRKFILKSLDFYKPQKITVLGSGWLLDLPLKEMIDIADEINLVDIIHPPEVIRQVASLKNVKVREEDITGGLIAEVWQKARRKFFLKKLHTLGDIVITEYNPQDDPGMVISLNIFTQLESQPVEFLKKRTKIDNKGYLHFRKEIQKKHIDFLKKHKSVLITDLSEVITDNSGNVTEDISVITDLPEGKYKEEWTWHFDTKRSDYYNKRSFFKILALMI